ncbi:MAG: Nramp family divalent metal transporter [Xanthomonadales bacterium]|nr:Nramp family divalent metal transporter [Xanthomonadales bacterium]
MAKLSIGPGALVAAAFIGPGTVTACTVAGADFGMALVWALVFATVATVVLQEMSARLGVGARLGLGEALMAGAGARPLRWAVALLVLVALGIGNSAYQAGNLTGASLGVEALVGPVDRRLVVAVLALLAALALMSASYRRIERVLLVLVAVMALAFAGSAVLVRPDLSALFAGLVPKVPAGGLLTAVALIGTTIVPYNLFLHAAAARERWSASDGDALAAARIDTGASVGLGGLVSILILATAAATVFGTGATVTSGADLARSIEPVFGTAARWLVGAGLFAAGLTSAITAPLAAAYAVAEVAGRPPRGALFRGVALAVLLVGTAVALLGLSPVRLILLAQVANGILLPVVAGFLLYTMNRADLLGRHRNGPASNLLGAAVLLVTIGLGLRLVLRALGLWP